jgi:ribonucleoside-diphosphate reductase alpha chain
LAEHLTVDEQKMDWSKLEKTIVESTRFLDNVVSANNYVPTVPQLREAAENVRRIGLGIMGLADTMYMMGIRYGSETAQEFSAQIIEFVRFHSMKTSIALAKERGPFVKIRGSIYDPEDLKWTPPTPLKVFTRDWERPVLDWNEVVEGIKAHGIRNGAQTTVAPTGTISTVAGVEGYGCEPVFALAYNRNVYQAAGDEKKMTLTYVSPSFQRALDMNVHDEDIKNNIIEKVALTGTCQDVNLLPDSIKDVYVVSADITPDEHILMQASIQAFIDNSISKTCNFPEGASKEDVAKVYMKGWELGCKGLTVYVAGSRQEVVLETKATQSKKEAVAVEPSVVYERPYKLQGSTYKLATPQGRAFITINKNDTRPKEVFINVGKAGSDVAALSEGLGRLISGWLMSSSDSDMTIKEIISQLVGIGGTKSIGFGKNRVSSIPDAVAKVLAEEFDITIRSNGSNIIEEKSKEVTVFSYTELCPECGNSSMVLEEGCAKCYNCGYSRC